MTTSAPILPAVQLAVPARDAALLRVRGVVQGVGFRPFVHRLALRHGLGGWVRNTATGVDIAVEGRRKALAAFVSRLAAEAPPLARIESIERIHWDGEGRSEFVIAPSALGDDGRQSISPDAATCEACLRELLDPLDRRHHYPFITCTDCGPRFSVIESMPYDRERTSMRAFTQCDQCRREYRTPYDRRFHSETNSCPACGPRLWLSDADGRVLDEDRGRAIQLAATALDAGQIVAIRGLGGFHLACDATSEPAVARLRERKRRDAKPLAIMVAWPADAHRLAELSAEETELLESPERPIVVARRRDDAGLAAGIAPGVDSIGVLLAYTPLHYLLLERFGRPLVMTSGNRSDEPIATGNEEALERLGGIADLFLMHDRDIVTRYDDSVVRDGAGGAIMLRRSRGYAPLPLTLPVAAPLPLVAVGPHLKNTFCLATGARAFVSQHIGDLEDLETLQHFRAALSRTRALFRIEPQVVVHDLHPGYLSTRIATELGPVRLLGVQHHHAHVAAVLAEHGMTGPAVGLAFDGTGYGEDGCVWGSEVMVADLTGYRRRGHLRYAPLPGGDLAARAPWRAALGYASLDPERAVAFDRAFDGIPAVERRVAELQIRRNLNAPQASSMGRLFDAAAALLGVRSEASFEGQAAMELESLAGTRPAPAFPLKADEQHGMLVMDPVPLLASLGAWRRHGADVAELAAMFHESIAGAAAELALRVAETEHLDTVVLSGGCFQNQRLLAGVIARLQARGIGVLVPRRLPPNDGAISYGQAAIAAARLSREG